MCGKRVKDSPAGRDTVKTMAADDERCPMCGGSREVRAVGPLQQRGLAESEQLGRLGDAEKLVVGRRTPRGLHKRIYPVENLDLPDRL
jgi:hypothetical protein